MFELCTLCAYSSLCSLSSPPPPVWVTVYQAMAPPCGDRTGGDVMRHKQTNNHELRRAATLATTTIGPMTRRMQTPECATQGSSMRHAVAQITGSRSRRARRARHSMCVRNKTKGGRRVSRCSAAETMPKGGAPTTPRRRRYRRSASCARGPRAFRPQWVRLRDGRATDAHARGRGLVLCAAAE